VTSLPAALPALPGLRSRGAAALLPAALLALALAVLLNATNGAALIPASTVISALLAPLGLAEAPDPGHAAILWAVRFPRIGLALLVGAALAVAGALMQGVFRNPLADPGVLGVSAGAALGAASVQVLVGRETLALVPEPLRPWVLSIAAFGGAVATAAFVGRLGQRGGVTTPESLLLAGVAVNSGLGGALALLLWIADDGALRDVTAWMMGSLGGATPGVLLGIGPLLGVALILGLALRRPLDALVLGEAEAGHLGIDAGSVRRRVIVLAALLVGAAVSVSGIIGFVGLVVPHLVRLAAGATHRVVLVGSLLLGPTVLLLADLGARTFAAPAEVPIGALTSLLGTPFFIALLRGRRA
jgi:iron complex transport system permease protein